MTFLTIKENIDLTIIFLFSDLLNQYDVYVMPVMNPDGYEYTRESNRMWRKTRC